MQVKIYTYTTIRGPAERRGAIGYLLSAETAKGPVSVSGTQEVECSGNYAALLAVLAALRRLTKPCGLVIYTDSAYVANGIRENAARWQQAGWKNSRGGDTAHREEWQECLARLAGCPVEVECGKIHEYYFRLRTETRRKEVAPVQQKGDQYV